jgi:prefoldin subunit 5
LFFHRLPVISKTANAELKKMINTVKQGFKTGAQYCLIHTSWGLFTRGYYDRGAKLITHIGAKTKNV